VLLDMFGYFNAITAARREHPTDDLAAPTHSIQHQLRVGFARRAVGQAAEENGCNYRYVSSQRRSTHSFCSKYVVAQYITRAHCCRHGEPALEMNEGRHPSWPSEPYRCLWRRVPTGNASPGRWSANCSRAVARLRVRRDRQAIIGAQTWTAHAQVRNAIWRASCHCANGKGSRGRSRPTTWRPAGTRTQRDRPPSKDTIRLYSASRMTQTCRRATLLTRMRLKILQCRARSSAEFKPMLVLRITYVVPMLEPSAIRMYSARQWPAPQIGWAFSNR
jgi:hypothetical protein